MSKAYRGVPNMLHDKLVRIGLDENDCSVFLFKGIGYWICPPFFNINVDNTDVVRISYLYKEPGRKRTSRILHLEDPIQVKESIGEMLDVALKADGFILTHAIRRQWFNPKRFTLAKINGKQYYRLRTPTALLDAFPSELRSKEVTPENAAARLVEMRNLHEACKQFVYDHLSTTKEQAMIFYKEDPTKEV